MLWRPVAVCVLCIPFLAQLSYAQNMAPSSGEITVRTSQVIDSAVLRPGQAVQGTVQSNSPEVPKGSLALMGLIPDQSGITLKLIRIQANGRVLNASSSSVRPAPGLFNKVNNMRRGPGEPEVSATGPRIYLHVNTDIVFALAPAPTPPPTPPTPGGGQRVARQTPPPPPPHPANTVRDLPAAAPGYPPIHASHDAREKCWWQPFVSEKLGLEAAVETCVDKTLTPIVVQMEDGLGFEYQGATPVSAPQRFVRVVTKPAGQTIESAIKQQFISKLKVPAARTACRAIRGHGDHDPSDTGVSSNNPNLLAYAVAASGPYSKLKKFQGEEAESPCEDLEMNDAVSAFFIYNPTENKTKYLFFQEEDDGPVFDQDSVHFLAPSSAQ